MRWPRAEFIPLAFDDLPTGWGEGGGYGLLAQYKPAFRGAGSKHLPNQSICRVSPSLILFRQAPRTRK